jgi:hypothetical protein
MANWHGATATATYTYSKVIDNSSEVYSTLAGGNTTTYAQNPFNTAAAEKGVSGYDYPHVFGLTLIYDFPFYKGQHGFAGKVLGGWQLNSTYRYTSGQAYTVVQQRANSSGSFSYCDQAGTFSTRYDACRPILSNPSAPIDAVGICTNSTPGGDCGLSQYLGTATAGDPTTANAVHWIINNKTAALFYGSPFLGAGRNIQRGQPISTANLGMFKNTKITEKVTLQLRATAYNFMNVQFRGNPDPIIDDVGIGTFGNTNFNSNGGATFAGSIVADGIAQRRLEFGGKIIF